MRQSSSDYCQTVLRKPFVRGARVRIHFGDCQADEQAQRLWVAGTPTHVSAKALALLFLLIAHRPRVVSKQEIHAALWPDVYVSDGNLAMLVRELRTALGDDARNPIYIRTAHRRGYAFEAALEPAQEGTDRRHHTPGLLWIVALGTRHHLSGGTYTIGRDPACDIWLNAPSVSRRHARLTVTTADVLLEDLDSRNGTFIDERPIAAPTAIVGKSRIRCGHVSITLQRDPDDVTRTEGEG